MRFSKELVERHITTIQEQCIAKFEELEGKEFDDQWGTAQATTSGGEAYTIIYHRLGDLCLDLGLND